MNRVAVDAPLGCELVDRAEPRRQVRLGYLRCMEVHAGSVDDAAARFRETDHALDALLALCPSAVVAGMGEALRICLEGRRPDGSESLDDVLAAACDLIAWQQLRLREHWWDGDTLAPDERHELVLVQYHAVEAVRERTSKPSVAKRMQLEQAGGLPLAICYGVTSLPVRTSVGPRWATFENLHSGCGRIFRDSRALKGHLFALRCNDCNHKRRNPERAARRRAEREARSRSVS